MWAIGCRVLLHFVTVNDVMTWCTIEVCVAAGKITAFVSVILGARRVLRDIVRLCNDTDNLVMY